MKKILIIACLILLGGCSAKSVETSFFAMDTYMSISLSGTDEDALAAEEEIKRLDMLLKYDSINMSEAETELLAEKSYEISRFTDGAFDITVAPVMELWGFRDKNYRVPEEREIKEALKTVGYNKISQGTKYDFGAIGKGYAGDKVSEILKKRSVKSGILSLGGNVHAIGTKPDGSLWKVGIQNPDREGYVGYVKVSDKAVVTSGGYERYFENDGRKYSHIINPKTGCPVENDVKSVTVICESGALADALSTAFFVMGSEETQGLCRSSGNKFNDTGFSVIIIKTDGEILTIGNTEFEKVR